MGRLLAVLAIIAAVLASLAVWLVSGGNVIAMVCGALAIAAGIVILLGRTAMTLTIGIVVALLGILALLFALGSINIKGTSTGVTTGDSFAYNTFPALACLAVVAAFVFLSWDRFNPSWIGIAAAVLIVAAAGTAFLVPSDRAIGGIAMLPGILALLCCVPAILVLVRNGYDEPAPATTTSARKHA